MILLSLSFNNSTERNIILFLPSLTVQTVRRSRSAETFKRERSSEYLNLAVYSTAKSYKISQKHQTWDNTNGSDGKNAP